MNKHRIKLIEYPWLVIAFFLICVGTLLSEFLGITSPPSKYDSQADKYLRYFVVLALTIYLGLFRVWPNKITIDLISKTITIQDNCPYIFNPAQLLFGDIKSIAVVSRVATGCTSKVYYLSITDSGGKVHGFGGTSNEDKYEQWKAEILSVVRV